MKELTIIIPIVELNDSEKYQLFYRAVDSAKVNDGPIIIVGDDKSLKTVTVQDERFELLENTTGDNSYASQVNFAVKKVKTKYFSVLEYDDVITSYWANSVEKYVEEDTDNTFAFLPLTEVVDYKTSQTIGYANEAFWASSFSEEIGCPDIHCMEDYLNFNTSGGVFKTDEFLSLGALKKSMKLVFWYEFLLRVLYKGKRIFVIPKIGYIHNANRDDSLTSTYAKEMSGKEADWWLDLAKKEYFFPQDRNKVYEEK